MENSAKALLIAGSILLFILLSSFAAYIFTKTKNQTDNIYDLMLSTDVTTFNQKFTAYEGKELTIQDVVSIINLAKDYNRTAKLPVELKVSCESGIIDGTSETNLLSQNIDINSILYKNLGKKYKCGTSYGVKSNLIETIKIEKSE